MTTRDGPSTTEAHGLTIQQASELLMVPPSTLRSWERRYALPTTARTAGGHRRYTEEALIELRLMRDEIARGKRAAEAAAGVRVLRQVAGSAAGLLEDFLTSAINLDPAGIRTCLDHAEEQLGLGDTIDEVLMPAMRRIGRWWETGRCDIAHEHMATEAARTWLGKIIAFAPEPQRSSGVLLACGPRDVHTLGLDAFAALLTRAGWPCRVLGARTPVSTLLAAAATTKPGAVIVVAHLAVGRRPATEAIHRVARLGIPVFYSGNAFIAAPSRRRLPATYLGDNLQHATQVLEATLASRT